MQKSYVLVYFPFCDLISLLSFLWMNFLIPMNNFPLYEKKNIIINLFIYLLHISMECFFLFYYSTNNICDCFLLNKSIQPNTPHSPNFDISLWIEKNSIYVGKTNKINLPFRSVYLLISIFIFIFWKPRSIKSFVAFLSQ